MLLGQIWVCEALRAPFVDKRYIRLNLIFNLILFKSEF